jgi:phosphoglycolate phosphatase-like HAD superfamily hydrolase
MQMNKLPVQAAAILWDFDGTIVDSFGVVMAVLEDILPTHGLVPPTPEVLARNYHGPLLDSISNSMGGLSPTLLEAIMVDFLEVQNKHYELIEHHLIPDALRLAQRAHQAGLIQAVVTNRDHQGRGLASPRSIVERSAYKPLISKVFAGDDGPHRKPNPALLGTFLEDNYLQPEDVLVIGDQFVDAELALNLGSGAVIVDPGDQGMVHAERLPAGWQDRVSLVTSLDQVQLSLATNPRDAIIKP